MNRLNETQNMALAIYIGLMTFGMLCLLADGTTPRRMVAGLVIMAMTHAVYCLTGWLPAIYRKMTHKRPTR